MGTRNLTIVYLDNDYKVAQYGQWDGYPSCTGLTVLHFIRDKMKREVFERGVRSAQTLTADQVTEIKKQFAKTREDALMINEYNDFSSQYPSLSRDTGADILEMIQNSGDNVVKLYNDIGFAADSLFCEWGYVIDLDHNTFEVYKGFNKTPLDPSDRFYFLRHLEREPSYIGDKTYHAIKLVRSWQLDNLPSDEDFMNAFKEDE